MRVARVLKKKVTKVIVGWGSLEKRGEGSFEKKSNGSLRNITVCAERFFFLLRENLRIQEGSFRLGLLGKKRNITVCAERYSRSFRL